MLQAVLLHRCQSLATWCLLGSVVPSGKEGRSCQLRNQDDFYHRCCSELLLIRKCRLVLSLIIVFKLFTNNTPTCFLHPQTLTPTTTLVRPQSSVIVSLPALMLCSSEHFWSTMDNERLASDCAARGPKGQGRSLYWVLKWSFKAAQEAFREEVGRTG
jgi:hypothetical protein